MGATCFGCGCAISTSMFQCGEYERPVMLVSHCHYHAIKNQELLSALAENLLRLIDSDPAPRPKNIEAGLRDQNASVS